MKKKKKIIKFIICLLIIVIAIGFINPLTTTSYNVSSKKIGTDLDGFTIVQVSDFHCKSFGKEESKLIDEINNCKPDVIFLTGDMIDGDHPVDNVEYLLKGICDTCPIYQVTGNHEKDNPAYMAELSKLYKQYGVININDKTTTLSVGDSKIFIGGIDYNAFPDYWDTLKPPSDVFSILLYHNASAFDDISKLGYDLVLSGHAHGGIIRLPLVGGIISTDLKLGARYEKGIYEKNNSTLIANTGLGAAPLPRFYNRREIVKITLHS